MLAHLFKPIWKRKTRNLMLSLEIGLAFAVVFAIAAAATRFAQLYHQPIGFDYDNVWSVQIQTSDASGIKNDPATYDTFRRALLSLPGVEKVAFAAYSPYENDTWRGGFHASGGGIAITSNVIRVDDDFFDTVHMPIVRGRAFSRADDGTDVPAVLVNRRFAQAMFPGQDPLGKLVGYGKSDLKDAKPMRIVGVVDDFRNEGEYMAPVDFLIQRYTSKPGDDGAATMLLRVRPGTQRAFEAALSERLKLLRSDWSYRISPLGDLRKTMLKQIEVPLVVFSIIAAFLLLMVGFGLFGVLWQNTTRRIPEIGLRRAAGATSAHIYRQIVIEQLMLTGLAVAVAMVLLVQLPITGVFGENLDWQLFAIAALESAMVMALVSVLCSLYPAWRASQLSPTQALQYE